MTNQDLTIIITTFKSQDKVEKCLNSIDPDLKIIIIENSNDQKFKNYIQSKFSNTQCILTGDNLGYGKANNIGLKIIKSKYCLILNPDTELDKNSITNFFYSIKQKLNFAIIGPDQNEKSLLLKTKNNQSNFNPIKVNSIKGYAMFLNMEKFTKIGFFDENFFLYLEEIDLCRRVIKAGENIYIDNNIKVFHHGGQSVDANFSYQIKLTKNWHWMWSLFYYNKKHYSFFFAFCSVFPKLFSSVIKIFFYSILFERKKKEIYLSRLSGLVNSILGKPSWQRPNL